MVAVERALMMRSIVADIRGLIHDAWEFYAPSAVRLAIIMIIWLLLDDAGYFGFFVKSTSDGLKRLGESGAIATLDRFKLTALMPLLALFIISLLIYSADRIVFIIAALFPLDIAYSSSALYGMYRRLSHVWRWCPAIEDITQLFALMELTITKARLEGKEIVLEGLDSWQKKQRAISQQTQFLKFLVLWTLAVSLFFVTREGVSSLLVIRAGLISLSLLALLLLNVLREIYVIDQIASKKIWAVASLLALEGKKPLEPDDIRWQHIGPHISAGENEAGKGWWWLQFRSMPWRRMIRNYKVVKLVTSARKQSSDTTR